MNLLEVRGDRTSFATLRTIASHCDIDDFAPITRIRLSYALDTEIPHSP